MIHFLDFEASSLDEGSYPIEAGWASLDLDTGEIVSEGMLIEPVSYWKDWNPASEAIHGIARASLVAHGYSTRAVTQRMNMMLGGIVLCDGGDFDQRWCDRLYEASGEFPSFRLASYWDNLRIRMYDHGCTQESQFAAYDRFRAPRPHRAEEDARLLAELFRDCLTF